MDGTPVHYSSLQAVEAVCSREGCVSEFFLLQIISPYSSTESFCSYLPLLALYQ